MRKAWLGSLVVVGIGALSVAPGCGGSKNGSGFGGPPGSGDDTTPDGSLRGDDGGTFILPTGDDGGTTIGDGSGGPCVNLQCQQHSCDGGASTTVSGKVYDPAGKNPLYDVVVYVPNKKPDPMTTGITSGSCSCDSLYTGEPIASALTGPDGSFTLTNVPDGTDIPLVIQIGKWRKQTKVHTVARCQDNPQPDKSLTLPSKADATNDIPSIAVSTGGADSLECLLLRAGVDASEYTGGAGGTGHIHIFQGCGGVSCGSGLKPVGPAPNTATPGPASSTSLWDKAGDIDPYDIVLLSCEGTGTVGTNSQVLSDYVTAGGRVFAEHWHYTWFADLLGNPVAPFPADLATWQSAGAGLGQYPGSIESSIVTTLPSGQPFPKGVALGEWMANVGALTGNIDAGQGELSIAVARADALVGSSNTKSQAWIQSAAGVTPPSTQYFSFDMPFDAPLTDAGVPGYCGRVVFSDLHIGAAANDYAGATADPNGHTGALTTPSGCTTVDLSPDEKALEFMLFDLSSCVTPVTATPKPPPTPPPPPPK